MSKLYLKTQEGEIDKGVLVNYLSKIDSDLRKANSHLMKGGPKDHFIDGMDRLNDARILVRRVIRESQ